MKAKKQTPALQIALSGMAELSLSAYNTPSALITVKESDTAITSDPANGQIARGAAVQLPLNQALDNVTWSYGTSTAGLFTAISGSPLTQILWRAPGLVGSYYIKRDATLNGSSQVFSLVSQKPLAFVSSGTQSQPGFGVSGHHQ